MSNHEHTNASMHQGHNDSIGCVVTECKYHANDVDYCTLHQIKVVKHEHRADTKECTDCGSFERSMT